MANALLSLIIGIKRSVFRANDPRRLRSDAEFRARRPHALAKHQHRCAGCGYESKQGGHLDVHHLDDNHDNNAEDNLVPACHACHPYQHVGELARRSRSDPADVEMGGEGLGKQSLLIVVPELDASDLNLLQRAIGVALLDPELADVALRLHARLETRAGWAIAEFGTCKPADFAAAMARLSDDEYAFRDEAVADVRLLFSKEHLNKMGRQFLVDNPSMPIASWPMVAEGVAQRSMK